ncbi:TIGR02611 family protein [Tsukamurella sp. 1534]|uniref:TIGR02611 family protein n=1 Tax=Tsukamurella sp. 1534 TaxID=1151061 RepID=UPI0002FA5DA9|nr:TIGR02611 family protein [Tsukamurella sp. 1534]
MTDSRDAEVPPSAAAAPPGAPAPAPDDDPAAAAAASLQSPGVLAKVGAWRAKVRSTPQGRLIWRIAVGLVGGVVLIAGIVMIPYPGPGWVMVFTGLGILASEFPWAQRLLGFVKVAYGRFRTWYGKQGPAVKALFALGTCLIVVLTLWLLGALQAVGNWMGLDWPWLASPITK